MFSYLKPRNNRIDLSASTYPPIEKISSLELAFPPNQRPMYSSHIPCMPDSEPKAMCIPPRIWPTMQTPYSIEPEDNFNSPARWQRSHLGEMPYNVTEGTRLYKSPIANSVDNSHQHAFCSIERQEIRPYEEEQIYKIKDLPTSNKQLTDCMSKSFPNVRSDLDGKRPCSRMGKTKFNLLNPMSLLSRRRPTRASTVPSHEPHKSNPNRDLPSSEKPEFEYDPRIRGTVVHDFSAPRRPGGNYSILKIKCIDDVISYPLCSQSSPDYTSTEESPSTPHSDEHQAQIFTERFENEPDWTPEEPHTKNFSLTELVLSNARYFPLGSKAKRPGPASNQGYNLKDDFAKKKPTAGTPSERPDSIQMTNNLTYCSNISLSESNHVPTAKSKPLRVTNRWSSSSEESYFTTECMDDKRPPRFSFEMAEIPIQEKEMEETYRKKALQKKYEAEIYRMMQSYDRYYECESTDYDNMDNRLSDYCVRFDASTLQEMRFYRLLHEEFIHEKAKFERARFERAGLGKA